VKKSSDEKDDDGTGLKSIVETESARKAREKAEWGRLSFVEKLVKKYLPIIFNIVNFLLSNIGTR